MTTSALDGVRAEQFAGRLVGLLNESKLSLMVSVGHRTGLFDTLATLPPATSVEVAEAAGLDERYVREWLDAMTVGRFVDHERNAGSLDLPQILMATVDRHPRQIVRELADRVLSLTGGSLRNDATVVCIDWYGSMGERDASGGASRSRATT